MAGLDGNDDSFCHKESRSKHMAQDEQDVQDVMNVVLEEPILQL